MNRDVRYDVMRVVAIVLVVLQHAWSIPHLDSPEYGWLCYVYGALVSCGVPLFIMVSGALNLRPAVSDYGTFFKKRLTRVLVPFVIWATVIFVLTALTGGYAEVHGWQDALRCYLPYLATNRINASHWFIHVLLMLYLITPVLQRALAAGDARKTAGYILCVVLALAVLAKVYPELYVLRFTSELLIYFGLYVAGFYLSQFSVNRTVNILVGSLAFAGLYVSNVILARPAYLLVALSAAGLFMLMLGIDNNRRQSAKEPVVTVLSRYTYFIYLIHVPFVHALYMVMGNPLPSGQAWLNLLLPPVVAVCVVAVTAAAGWCVEKLLKKNALYLGVAARR
ncbi:MAG: acyltransferase [Paludibacteraceae bacterium]|nr:acyltransferase [Paludibacteraceae bacterium]